MPVFICTKCFHIENTATSNYVTQVIMNKEQPLCHLCDPNFGDDEFSKIQKERSPRRPLDNEDFGHLEWFLNPEVLEKAKENLKF